MRRPPPTSTRTDKLFPYTTLFRSNKAREYIAGIQVLSQQIAKFSAEAVSGGFEAFFELKSTRGRIETLVRNLLNGNPDDNVPAYQGQAGVGDPLQKLVDSWTPVNKSAQRIAEREERVLGLADTASELSGQEPTHGRTTRREK